MSRLKLIQTLFTAHRSEIVSYFKRHMPRSTDAEDLAQEVFLRLLRVEDITRIEEPRYYLFTIVNNLRKERYYTEGRRRKFVRMSWEKALESEPEQLAVELATDLSIDRERQDRCVREAFEHLSAADQELLKLHFVDGLSCADIGELQEKSKSSIRDGIRRALARCQKHLDGIKGGAPR